KLEWVRGLAWSPDSKQFALVGAKTRDVVIWDVEARKLVTQWEGNAYGMDCVAWAPNGKAVVSGGADRAVLFWDVERRRRRRVIDGQYSENRDTVWAPDGKRVATFGGGGSPAYFWDPSSGKLVGQTQTSGLNMLSLAWSPRDDTVAAGMIHAGETFQ